MSKFIEMVIREHYEKGVNKTMEKGRTLAFQVSEELFQRVKEYLDRYEKAYHRRLTQKEFVIGLIEQALEEAEEEFEAARAAEHEEQAENGWEPVSYTHLDVYKRQTNGTQRTPAIRCVRSCRARGCQASRLRPIRLSGI